LLLFLPSILADAHRRYGGMGTILVVKVGEYMHTVFLPLIFID